MTIYATDAERPVAGNTYIPDSMEARGRIRPIPPVTGERNGLGEQVYAGMWAYDWTFEFMTLTEMTFWKGLLSYSSVTGLPFSKRFVTLSLPAFRLWDTTLGLMTFNSGVLDLPMWEDYRNARFHNVTVHMAFLESES